MTVWYITMIFPAPAETFASNDVRTLARAGVEVSVHSLRSAHRASAKFLEERRLTAIHVTHADRSTVPAGLKVALRRPGLLLSLLAWTLRHSWKKPEHLVKSLVLLPRVLQLFVEIERERPDVVHIYWGHYPSLIGHLVQTHLPDTVVSISLAAYDLEMEYGGSGPVARQADMVRTLAKANVHHISQAFGVPSERITVLYDGVDLSRFRTLEAVRKVPRRIVTAGRLVPPKGMDDVLSTFSNILQRWPDASLVVLGDGPERERLEGLARSLHIDHAVTFRGHVNHEAVFEEMAQAEVFLFMSKKSSERLPNVVKEAMGCRCLCITTNTPGIEELLVNGEHGYIIAQGDVKSAAHYINRVFSDGSALKGITDAAYQHLERNFDLEEITSQYSAEWEALVCGRKKFVMNSISNVVL